MTALKIQINKKTYPNGTCTIDDLRLSAEQGEFVAIVGPSGTGKTTLLNIVAGIDKDVDGSISLNDRAPDESTIGFMFQDARLMPWLTVEQNIQLVLNESSADMNLRMDQLLERVGLSEFGKTYPSQLSGGMKRRASLVRAFINHPQMLLMDEPFQSLDKPTANTLRQLLLDLWNEAKPTVLFVTHSLREALALADRIIFLSDRPSSVIMDYTVDIPRPRELEGEAVNSLHSQLLKQYPELLSGLMPDVSVVSTTDDGDKSIG
jgi:NitT/TauT family transport system ATP-binding protein